MLKGEIILKGDKSITHRAIMLAAVTEGETKIINPSNCIDVQSSINVLNMCGSKMYYDGNVIINTSKIYKNPDNQYKEDKPKYIELYSKKPPNIAPKIFADKAWATDFNFINSFSK